MIAEKEIFNQIAISIINVLPQGISFKKAILEIKRLENNIGYTGYYILDNELKQWLDIFSFKLDNDVIENLYKITQTQAPIHKNWNRAIFTLYPNATSEMEYIWDEELQQEVDGYNNPSTT